MKILGIDPGLYISGYGLIDWRDRRATLLTAGVVKTKKSDKTQNRLESIYNEMIALVKELHPENIALEKIYSHYRHPATSYALGQARGVICLICSQLGVPLFEYSSTHIKKAITGKGRASKEQIQKMVQQLLRIKNSPKYFDITDALAVAIAHIHTLRRSI